MWIVWFFAACIGACLVLSMIEAPRRKGRSERGVARPEREADLECASFPTTEC